MTDKKTIVEAFLKWFENDQHKEYEDSYKETFTLDYLNSLSKEEFIAYFFEFAREGGKIQSRGYRTAGNFKTSLTANYDEFRTNILDLFGDKFNIDSWLSWADKFKDFGKGLSTIILNRRAKNKYVIVNNKSIEGLQKIGYEINSTNFLRKYKSIFEAEKSLLNDFPELENFYRVDALMHFIIGTVEGKKIMNEDSIMDYFNLDGFEEYSLKFGAIYDPNDPATEWWKDTKTKLEYLVGVLKIHLKDNISINYTEKPNARAGRGKPFILKNYILTGFSPDDSFHDNGELFIKLAFHNLNTIPVFDIELDQNRNAPEKPFNLIIDEIRESSRKSILVDEDFPFSWDALVVKIQDYISELITKYRNLINNNTVNPDQIMKFPLNTILYGPPGTGKTFHSISHAISIIDNEAIEVVKERCETDRESIKNRFDELVEKGQIIFSTFHQSMSYEDFIEGIKPIKPLEDDKYLKYDIQDGVLKKICTEAAFTYFQTTEQEEIESFETFDDIYVKYIAFIKDRLSRDEEVVITTKSKIKYNITEINNEFIGLQKTVKRSRLRKVAKSKLLKLSKAFPNLNNVSNIHKEFRNVVGGNTTVTWAVLNDIRNNFPQVVKSNEQDDNTDDMIENVSIDYIYKKDAINQLVHEDYQSENDKRFVLIIDEINRGNVSQIFGELITLIEQDKRLGQKEAITVTLPYSGEEFGVPPNIFIIGTMNTADRSVEALDTALRRRFSFVHMIPDERKLTAEFDGIILSNLLITINKRLSILKDADHTIGHAWLMGIDSLPKLQKVFKDRILPLLQEYFYNDYEKLGLVLGDGFFDLPHKKVVVKEFANFSGGNGLSGQYNNKFVFKLKDTDKLEIEDFLTLCAPTIMNDGQ